jgi:hypothetical protein
VTLISKDSWRLAELEAMSNRDEPVPAAVLREVLEVYIALLNRPDSCGTCHGTGRMYSPDVSSCALVACSDCHQGNGR